LQEEIGRNLWIIPEGYIPGETAPRSRAMVSHEAACILNPNDRPAEIDVVLYFSDREPVGPYHITVEPRRTRHLRFNDLRDPAPVPRDTDYSSVIRSSTPVIVQHTRLDSRQPPHALLTTTAWAP
jgi:hypothetical protein